MRLTMKVLVMPMVAFVLLAYHMAWADGIDIVWSTYLGGEDSGESGAGIAVDDSGYAYVTGHTNSGDFPTTPGCYCDTSNLWEDVFVTKFNLTGSALIYSTYIVGSDRESGAGIAIDGSGNAYVTGRTSSFDFPTTPGAFDTTCGSAYGCDAFVVKLNQTGSGLVYSTFLGGYWSDSGSNIEVDNSGYAFVIGITECEDFPVTTGAFDTTLDGDEDAFVTKLNLTGSFLDYSTFLGGDYLDYGHGIAVDDVGNAYVTGSTQGDFPTTPGAYADTSNGLFDAFMTKIAPAGDMLIYSTYLGGSSLDYGRSIAVDESGHAYVTGYTASVDFPTTAGAYDETHNGDEDAFVTKLNSAGSDLDYSTFLGGDGWDHGYGIAVDEFGNAYVAGAEDSYNFPYSGQWSIQGFVVKLNTSGDDLVCSRILGGDEYPTYPADYLYSIALDEERKVYVSGMTYSPNYPVKDAFDDSLGGGLDACVTVLVIDNPPQVTVDYPNGGETLDDSVTVTWSATDADPGETALLMMDLEYSANAGGSWTVIDSNQTNDGAYFWDITALVEGNSYLVRISATDTTGLSRSDTSDSVFTIAIIPEPPEVMVTYPNGGETLEDSVTIHWTTTDPDPGEAALHSIDLDYSANGGGSWSVIDSNQANDGSYFWDIFALAEGDSYLVRVTATDTAGLSGSDLSDSVFTIVTNLEPPEVTLTYPNGGETEAYAVTVTWTATDPDPGETALLMVDLDYSSNGGGSWAAIAGNETNDGAYLWDLSGLSEGSDYLVRVTVTDTVGFSDADTSDGIFAIVHPVMPIPLNWSTFLGSGEDEVGYDIAVDGEGAVYITGNTYSSSFPTVPGSFDETHNGDQDAFVCKLHPTGSALVYSTFLGGSSEEECHGIAVDDSGNAYLHGWTASSGFPTTYGAFDTTKGGNEDAFVVKLNSCGSALEYSTFLGGGSPDYGQGIAVDNSGQAYLTGRTRSENFPVTPGAYDTYCGGFYSDAYVVKLNSTGSDLDYGTFLGGTGTDIGNAIAIDASGCAYVTGETQSEYFPTTPGAFDETYNGGSGFFEYDAFVTKLNATGSDLEYSTFLGGGESGDWGQGIAVDDSGNVHVTGETRSSDFPTSTGAYDETLNGLYDAFVVKFDPTGSELKYSTFLGGGGSDRGKDIALDGSGDACVVGVAGTGFPTTAGAFDTTYNGGHDAFVAELTTTGNTLTFSTFLGGTAEDECYGIALDYTGGVYIIGRTESEDFPTTEWVCDTTYNDGYDVFVSKFYIYDDITPPEAIGDLTILLESGAKSSTGDMRLIWSEPYDDVGVTRYVVYRDTTADGSGDSLAGTTETTYLDVGAAGDTASNYFYLVKSVDAAGNKSGESNQVGEFDRHVITAPSPP